jgi:hypothetical protein
MVKDSQKSPENMVFYRHWCLDGYRGLDRYDRGLYDDDRRLPNRARRLDWRNDYWRRDRRQRRREGFDHLLLSLGRRLLPRGSVNREKSEDGETGNRCHCETLCLPVHDVLSCFD